MLQILGTFIVLLSFIAVPLGPSHANKRAALVIGNSAYKNAGTLKNPANDANLVAAALTLAKFDLVEARTDLGIADFRQALRRFQSYANGSEVALIYFAGHGVEAEGTNWLIPTDAELANEGDLEYEAIRIDLALRALAGARMRILVLDACRNNPLGRSWPSKTRSLERGLRPMDTDDVLVIYAAAPGRLASDGVGENSPFAASLATRLPETGLAIQLLGGRVRDDVLSVTQGAQRPYVSASITGEPYYLMPLQPTALPVPTPSDLDAARAAINAERERASAELASRESELKRREAALIAPSTEDAAGDTIQTARNLGTLKARTYNIVDTLSSTDLADVFKFSLGKASRFTVRTTSSKQEVTTALMDGTGRDLIIVKDQRDWIDTALMPGDYFLAAQNHTGMATIYALNIEVARYEPFSHPDLPHILSPVSSPPKKFNTKVDEDAREHYVRLDVKEATSYRFRLEVVRGDPEAAIDLKLLRRNSGGESIEIAKSRSRVDSAEDIVRRLEPGRYFLHISREAKGRAEVQLSAETFAGMVDPTFDQDFKIVSEHSGWKVVEWLKHDKKHCATYTLAKTATPSENWRVTKPYLLMRIEAGDGRVYHSFDKVTYYAAKSDVRASVKADSGTIPIPVSVVAGQSEIRTQSKCNANTETMCVSSEGLHALSSGRELTLTGVSSDGSPTVVVYSLAGYRQAVEDMNKACKNERRTNWLIKGL